MSTQTSSWIPKKRIHFVVGLAAALVAAALVGCVWSKASLLLLVPAAGAGWAAFVMLRIRAQLSGGWEHKIHEYVASQLGISAGARLLDIGCGDAGLLATVLGKSPGISATGVDDWSEHWDYAQAACEARLAKLKLSATFQRMDAAHLELSNECFDAVTSVMCFHEVRAPEGSATRGPLLALSEALRVLRPGGQFVLVDRFADAADYGDGTELAVVLKAAEVHRESLVRKLDVPWPLSSKRALGPVEVLRGTKR